MYAPPPPLPLRQRIISQPTQGIEPLLVQCWASNAWRWSSTEPVATQCIAQMIPYLMTLYKYKRFYHYIYKSFFGDELLAIISIMMCFSYHSDLLLYCLLFNVAM